MKTVRIPTRLAAICLVACTGSWLVFGSAAQSQFPAARQEPPERVFLRIQGVDGESTDRDHPGWIDIVSFTYGLSRPPIDPMAIDGPQPPANHRGLSLVKHTDRATGLLYMHCNNGRPIEEAVLEVLQTTELGVSVQEYRLQGVIVTAVQTSGGSRTGARATENVTLHYASVQWTHVRLDPVTGSVISEVAMQWDLAGSPAP
ncbi:MAG: type VI secretion system tube protein Hcp [Phycisphaerae bacterium]|nr:type VI secretion system tube protein Hcp [Phycisphaerae bacterium]